MAAEVKSKAFLARLPTLSHEERARVQAWAARNCARSRVYLRQGVLYMLALRECARTSKMQCRLLRSALARQCSLAVPTNDRRWLILVDASEDFERLMTDPTNEEPGPKPEEGEDERCVPLPSAIRPLAVARGEAIERRQRPGSNEGAEDHPGAPLRQQATSVS
jgi:hypothetical protein